MELGMLINAYVHYIIYFMTTCGKIWEKGEVSVYQNAFYQLRKWVFQLVYVFTTVNVCMHVKECACFLAEISRRNGYTYNNFIIGFLYIHRFGRGSSSSRIICSLIKNKISRFYIIYFSIARSTYCTFTLPKTRDKGSWSEISDENCHDWFLAIIPFNFSEGFYIRGETDKKGLITQNIGYEILELDTILHQQFYQ